jgi:uncharacterized protein (DUF2062 family)
MPALYPNRNDTKHNEKPERSILRYVLRQNQTPLSVGPQTAVGVTAAIDLILGLMFLFAPELGFTLWPTPIAPVLSRFIGSIIVANGVGAWLGVRAGTWEGPASSSRSP